MASGQNLTVSIARDLGVAIITGKYSAESPLPFEGELCKQYNVSRTVLREAVKMLTAKGLLVARPRLGTRVAPEDEWNLLDPDVLRWMLERRFSLKLLIQFTQARLGFEPAAAALAATDATDEGRAAISHAIERMFNASRGRDDPLEADIAFHGAVIRASGNPFYFQLQELVASALNYSIRRTNVYRDMVSVALEHKRVADAILERNPVSSERAMRTLVQNALDVLLDQDKQDNSEKPRKTRAAVSKKR